MTDQSAPYKHIHFIINPAAGQNEAILSTINRVLLPYDVCWTVTVTRRDGSLAADIPSDADLIGVYGGDGTVKSVVGRLIDRNLPLAILPGGTGNALAQKLGIPTELSQAVQLIMDEHQLRTIDLGEIRGADGLRSYFLLRATIGLHNEMLEATSSDLKQRYGDFAYMIGGIMSMNEITPIKFELTIDGKRIRTQGHTCIIANITTIGGHANLDFAPQVDPSDGQLNVFVFDMISEDLLSAIHSQLATDDAEFSRHWQGQQIQIHTEEAELAFADGEEFCMTDVEVQLRCDALKILVPRLETD